MTEIEISERYYRTLFRSSIKLLIQIHASLKSSRLRNQVADRYLEETGKLLGDIKQVKKRNDEESLSPAERRKARCTHEEPFRLRRIRGNGWNYAWRCGECYTYLKPNWIVVDAMGNEIGPLEPSPAAPPESLVPEDQALQQSTP